MLFKLHSCPFEKSFLESVLLGAVLVALSSIYAFSSRLSAYFPVILLCAAAVGFLCFAAVISSFRGGRVDPFKIVAAQSLLLIIHGLSGSELCVPAALQLLCIRSFPGPLRLGLILSVSATVVIPFLACQHQCLSPVSLTFIFSSVLAAALNGAGVNLSASPPANSEAYVQTDASVLSGTSLRSSEKTGACGRLRSCFSSGSSVKSELTCTNSVTCSPLSDESRPSACTASEAPIDFSAPLREGDFSEEKVEAVVAGTEEEARDLKQACFFMSESAKEASHEKQLSDIHAKYHSMKVNFDQEVAIKLKAQDDLSLQVQETSTMKKLYDEMKEGFDITTAELKVVRKAASRQVEQTHQAEAAYARMRVLYDQQQEELSKKGEYLSQAKNQLKVLRWMLPDPAQGTDSPELLEVPAMLENAAKNSETTTAKASTTGVFQDDVAVLKDICHGMKVPLNIALCSLHIALDRKVKIDERDRLELLQKALSSLQSAQMIVNNVNDYEKLCSSEIRAMAKKVHIRRLGVEALRSLEFDASEGNTELILVVDPSLPTSLRCDRVLLHRVLLNLISNSLKFTPGGRVALHFSWDATKSHLHCSVTDTGLGMGTNEQACVFKQYHQGGRGKAGQGLGLAVCQQLVTEMGGSISA
eukprot:RCo037408